MVFSDTPGSRDGFTRMISEATRDDSSFDFIVVWKLQTFSRSLEETIELCDRLRQVGTKLVSATEKGIDDDATAVTRGRGAAETAAPPDRSVHPANRMNS